MIYFVDIDNTIIISEYDGINYHVRGFRQSEIDAVNKKFEAGHVIIIWTGRGWHQYEITKSQLKEAGIKYHELNMSKPVGMYVDRDNIKSIEDSNE